MMAKPITDYRAFLHPKWNYQPVQGEKLRTRRRPGHTEIVRDHRTGEWVKLTYDEQVAI